MNAANAIREGLDQLDTTALARRSRRSPRAAASTSTARASGIGGNGGGRQAPPLPPRNSRSPPIVDGQQQRMSAATLQPGDAVFAISNSGRSKPVIEAVEIARSFGATTVALTRPARRSPPPPKSSSRSPFPRSRTCSAPRPRATRTSRSSTRSRAASPARLGPRGREALRRVRYTLARIGVAIPSPSTDPTPIMRDAPPQE